MNSFSRATGTAATAIALLMSAHGQVPPQNPRDVALNSVLMESTFKIEGRNNLGQPIIGTGFVMGRPYPQNPLRARYVLITAAHVLEEMQGQTAILYLR